ncbi:hypothetical protein AB3R30_19390 [Leptolyngbyaceae cyanobacterium UHCC 1019]
MIGQMCWLAKFGGGGELTLHLRLEQQQPWKPYTHFRGLAIPDHTIPGASKGFATSQKLLAAGWTLLSTAQVKASFSPSSKAA